MTENMQNEKPREHAGISPSLVAEELLNQRKDRGGSLTPLQLIKMVYLCQGWALGVTNTVLFEEDIEAWQYGPVIPSIYYAYREFGKKSIPYENIQAYPLGGDSANAITAEHTTLLEKTVKLVLDIYGGLTGPQLSNLTHQNKTPWQKVYQTGLRNQTIDKESIKEHFQILAQKYRKKD